MNEYTMTFDIQEFRQATVVVEAENAEQAMRTFEALCEHEVTQAGKWKLDDGRTVEVDVELMDSETEANDDFECTFEDDPDPDEEGERD